MLGLVCSKFDGIATSLDELLYLAEYCTSCGQLVKDLYELKMYNHQKISACYSPKSIFTIVFFDGAGFDVMIIW